MEFLKYASRVQLKIKHSALTIPISSPTTVLNELNFINLTGYGVFKVIWPNTTDLIAQKQVLFLFKFRYLRMQLGQNYYCKET